METWKGIGQLPTEKQIEISKQELFNCIELIISPTIKTFTQNFLSRIPEQFWEVPSSSTGKFHPPEDHGPGGLVRHEIKAVGVGRQYARRYLFSPNETDQMLAGIILHDTYKNGIPWSNNTDYTHGIIAAEQILTSPLSLEVNPLDKEAIANAVRYHMFPWHYAVDPFKKDNFTRNELINCTEELRRASCPSRIELAVREADYWASRENMSFIPGFIANDIDFRHDAPSTTN